MAIPVKTVLDLLPLFEGYKEFRGMDLGCGAGRNSIPVAQHFKDFPCRVDCVDILELDSDESYEKIRQKILLLNPTAEEKTIRKFIRG